MEGPSSTCLLNNSNWWPYVTHEVVQFGLCESDGVVTRNSATTISNPSSVNFIEIRNANHQQLVNHPNMTSEFQRIMIEGDFNPFFKVE